MLQVESLYSRLCLDSEKMAQLMALGFSEKEARLGLRACEGNLQEAAIHISNRRQVSLSLRLSHSHTLKGFKYNSSEYFKISIIAKRNLEVDRI